MLVYYVLIPAPFRRTRWPKLDPGGPVHPCDKQVCENDEFCIENEEI